MIRVVSALIHRSGRYLLQQRSDPRDFAGFWETPGGKVEKFESDEAALQRELAEELGSWDAGLGELLHQASFRPPVVAAETLIRYFWAEAPIGWRPRLLDADGLGWFTVREVDKLRMTPGTETLVRAMIECGKMR